MDPPITFSPYAGGSKRVLLIADVNNGEFLRFDYQGSWLYYYLVALQYKSIEIKKKMFCYKTIVALKHSGGKVKKPRIQKISSISNQNPLLIL